MSDPREAEWAEQHKDELIEAVSQYPDVLVIRKVDGEWPESVLRGLLSRKQMLDALLKESE